MRDLRFSTIGFHLTNCPGKRNLKFCRITTSRAFGRRMSQLDPSGCKTQFLLIWKIGRFCIGISMPRQVPDLAGIIHGEQRAWAPASTGRQPERTLSVSPSEH
jgi:hypothetical protein